MRKTVSLFMVFVVFPVVFADGMMHIYDQDMWNLGRENQQLAAIVYEDGFQNMLISVDIPDNIPGEEAVWIFPVPSDPEFVVIDILKGYPRLYGQDIDGEYNDAVGRVGLFMAGYSLFPISIPVIFMSQRLRGSVDMMEGVTVHDRIEKMGLTTELITTEDQSSLQQYLQTKGYDLPENSRKILDEYVGKKYSFVVSYISNLSQFSEAQRTSMDDNIEGIRYKSGNRHTTIGVFVKFPTEEIYFPLKPTSVYGSQEIPILIYVMGHVTPKLYPEIKQKAEVQYYAQRSYTPQAELRSFFNGKERIDNFKYTKIKLTTPSKYLVEDLWIEDSAPVAVSIKSFLSKTYWAFGIILYLLFSGLSSLIAGRIVLKEYVSRKRLLLHGLWNCLTLVGFSIATHALVTKPIDPNLQKQLKSQGLTVVPKDNRKVLYVFLFYVFFTALLLIFSQLLMHTF